MDQSIKQAVELIDSKIEEMTRSRELLISLGGGVSSVMGNSTGGFTRRKVSAEPKKRTMSADARARIALAQQKRWENIRAKQKKLVVPKKAAKKTARKKAASVKAGPKVDALVAPPAPATEETNS